MKDEQDLYPLRRGMRLPQPHWAPLYIEKLLESSFWTTVEPENAYYALNLWLVSLCLDPMGTLPTKPEELFRLARYRGRFEAFERRMPVILRKWAPTRVLTEDDGYETRLAHPFVTDVAVTVAEHLASGALKEWEQRREALRNRARRVMRGAMAPKALVEDPLKVDDFVNRMERNGEGFSATAARRVVYEMMNEERQGGLIPLMRGDME